MSYITHYSIYLHGEADYKTIFEEIEQQSDERLEILTNGSGACVYDTSWGNVLDDLSAVAQKHPEAIIEVYAEGEDRNDTWEARFKGDDVETVEYYFVRPEFRAIRLPKDEKRDAGKEVRLIFETDAWHSNDSRRVVAVSEDEYAYDDLLNAVLDKYGVDDTLRPEAFRQLKEYGQTQCLLSKHGVELLVVTMKTESVLG